jgi:hypothetical protein
MLDDFDTTNMQVHFSITNLGQSNSMSYDCEPDTTWDEVLNKVVQTLEAHYGYTFNLEDTGIYHSDKS